MSLIEFKHRKNGVLTNVVSAVLADSTDTYGVKRTDTNGVVVAAGTAMDHDAGQTGIYTYDITDPATGIEYLWYVLATYADGSTKRFGAYTQAVPGAHHGSRTGIEAHGLYNADVAADIESTGDAAEIAARFETALTRSDGIVAFEAAKLQVNVPASTDTVYYPQIVDGANTYALGYLMMGRGEPVAAGKMPAWQIMMEAGRQQIVDALTAYAASINYPTATNTGPSSGYVAYSNRVDVALNSY